MLVLALPAAHGLEPAVGDDLVGVHVGGGARAALDHVDHELVVELARDDLVARAHDGILLKLGEHTQLVVGEGGRLLHVGEGDDEVGEAVQIHSGDGEVLGGAQGLHAVVGVVGQLPIAEKIMLGAWHERSPRKSGGAMSNPIRTAPRTGSYREACRRDSRIR